MATNQIITYPLTKANLQKARADVQKSHYGDNLDTISRMLSAYPENKNKIEVEAKIAIIELTNSTNLSKHISKITLSKLADVIIKMNIDDRLKNGDPDLVDDLIEKVDQAVKAQNIDASCRLTSFLSKYCHYHNIDAYSKYDTTVKRVLPVYANKYAKPYIQRVFNVDILQEKDITDLFNSKNKAYKTFNDLVTAVLKGAHLENEKDARANFDLLMWYYNRKK